MKRLSHIVLLCCCLFFALGAQEVDPNQIPMMAQLSDGQVRLRWAPTSPMVWAQMRSTGMYLDRHTVMRDGKMLPLAERQAYVRLQPQPILPASEAAFGQRAAEEQYVAIAGQAIYGASFEVTSNQGENPDMGALINTAKEEQNRFYYSLFAADQSWEAANMMGLAYTDSSAQRNETYVYRLRPAAEMARLDTLRSCFVSIDAKNEAPGPKIQELAAEFGNLSVMLSWDMEVARAYYSSYWIERSEDGLSWEAVNDQAFVPVAKQATAPKRTFFQAKLPANNRPYFFRVTGRTPFGTKGAASDPVQGMGWDPLPITGPSIASIFPGEGGSFDIAWNFPEDVEIVAGFQVFRARKDEGPYEPISERLAVDARFFRDPAPMPSNYYQVTMYDQYERTLSSYSVLAQPDDTIPPAPPTNLRGIILKDGRVVVNWDENTEPDLLGYRIWISNQPEVEYTLATGEPLRTNYYIGTTTLNTLSSELYVKATALDIRHNPSDFTEYAILLRPDTIPPSAPLLTDLQADTNQIVLYWAQSQAPDIARHELYRKAVQDTAWQLLATYTAPEQADVRSYQDIGLPRGERYEYRLDAIDRSELRAASKTLEGKVIDNFIRRGIQNLKATADRRAHHIALAWTYEPENTAFDHFEIYRATRNGNFQLIATANRQQAGEKSGRRGQNTYTFTDTKPLTRNTAYRYKVKALYTDGGQSSLSAATEIDF